VTILKVLYVINVKKLSVNLLINVQWAEEIRRLTIKLTFLDKCGNLHSVIF